MKEKFLFLKGLNGLRTIAALSVVFSHISLSLKEFNVGLFVFGKNADGSPKGWYLGEMGVTIFFVLSGFLITYLLLLESKKAEINIKKFYIRRVLRIWPIYYLYLMICLVIIYFLNKSIDFSTVLYYLFFAANIPFIYEFALRFLDHFWSIGVEEQFYLFWPWIIKYFKKILVPLIIALVVIINITRYYLWWKFPFSGNAVFSIVNRFDCMMIGGLGAIFYESKNKLFLNLIDNKWIQSLAWIGIILIACNVKFINAIVDTSIITFISLILIIGQINVKNRVVNLDIQVLNFLGKISYGIYVYHIVIIYLFSLLLKNIVVNDFLKLFLIYSSIIGFTIFIATVSYYKFEKRFIKMKDGFAVIKSSSEKYN